MLLPRHALPDPSLTLLSVADTGEVAEGVDESLHSLDRLERRRHRRRTIDDPDTRAELRWMLHEEPMAFLSFAASTIALHGKATPALVRDLVRSGHPEAAALAAGLWWLCGLRPPEILLDVGLPPWLLHLDHAQLQSARRRRERHDQSADSYLVEVELVGGPIGTLHILLDSWFDDAVVHGFAADQSVGETMKLFRAATRLRRNSGLEVTPATPFRAVGVDRAALTLGASLRNTTVDAPINLVSPWPSVRSLLLFLVVDCANFK